MGGGALTLIIITAYLVGAAAAAPQLMRMIYRDNLTVLAQRQARHEQELAAWRAKPQRSGYNKPMWVHGTELDAMYEARRFGFWLSLAWPIALAYYRFGDHAFKQEIAALNSARNARIIADYDKLLAARFDKELAEANPRPSIINRLTRKERP